MSVLALLLLAATPLETVRLSPDTTAVLFSVTVNDEAVVAETLASATVTPLGIGPIPAMADLDGYHRLSNGHQLLSFDTSVVLPGGLTATPADVVRYDGSGYTLVFDAEPIGIPREVDVDALAMQGTALLLSFDVAVALEGLDIEDEDLVLYDGVHFSMFFDGSAAGIDPALDLDAADYLACNDHLLLSFDGSGLAGSLRFEDEDLLEHDRGTGWELAYGGAARHPAWRAADMDAVHATADLGPPVAFGQTVTADASKVRYGWADAAAYQAVRGSFTASSDIGAYAVGLTLSGSGTSLADAAVPAPGTGYWYLVKLGGCVRGSWQSTLGSEPGRDAALP